MIIALIATTTILTFLTWTLIKSPVWRTIWGILSLLAFVIILLTGAESGLSAATIRRLLIILPKPIFNIDILFTLFDVLDLFSYFFYLGLDFNNLICDA